MAAGRRLRVVGRCLTAPAAAPAASTAAPATAGQQPSLELAPLAARLDRPELSFGAECLSAGFDLAKMADSGAGVAEVYAALLAHGAVIFRGQSLNEGQEIALSQRFPHSTGFRPPALEYLVRTAQVQQAPLHSLSSLCALRGSMNTRAGQRRPARHAARYVCAGRTVLARRRLAERAADGDHDDLRGGRDLGAVRRLVDALCERSQSG